MTILPPEETARANTYGLLARLFAAPPDRKLLEAIASADDVAAENDFLVDPWLELAYAAADTDADEVREEYERVYGRAASTQVALERVIGACNTLRESIAWHQIGLPVQSWYFNNHLIPAAERLGKLSANAPGGRFYKSVDRFAAAFFRLERTAFQMSCIPD